MNEAVKLYVASSWRNERQPEVVKSLRDDGFQVYDFRHPKPGDGGFHWSTIDPEWKSWTPDQFRTELQEHTLCYFGFMNDFEAMQWADACVLVMPCGRSAHLEAGYFVGAGKPLYILLSDGEPELMYRMAWETGGTICVELSELLQAMRAKR